LLLLSFFSLNHINDLAIFSQSSNSHFGNQDLNIVAVGDFYCNDQTEDTIENIISIDPELIITTGDHVKNVKSVKCWIEMS
jgi:predicted MPP superfamily phosphohydrolase